VNRQKERNTYLYGFFSITKKEKDGVKKAVLSMLIVPISCRTLKFHNNNNFKMIQMKKILHLIALFAPFINILTHIIDYLYHMSLFSISQF